MPEKNTSLVGVGFYCGKIHTHITKNVPSQLFEVYCLFSEIKYILTVV